MKGIDIVRQLYSELPKYTDRFTDNIAVTSLTRSGTTVTAVTASAHGLVTGNYAFIWEAKNPITITSLTQSGGIATAVTSQDHDLTLNPLEVQIGTLTFIDIDGANEADYNGNHELLAVPDRNTFKYKINPAAPATATGSPILVNAGTGYNGWHEITLIDPTTFTYQTTYTPNSPAVGTIEAKMRMRISRALNFEMAFEAYTRENFNDFWAFVVIGDKTANKDREITSDATSTFGKGEDYRQLFIQPFSIYVIIPATGNISQIEGDIAYDIAGGSQRDAADELVRPFTKSVLRVRFPDGFEEDPYSGVTFNADRFFRYNNAVYVHEYVFEATGWMIYEDTTAPEQTAAFRDITLDFKSTLSTVRDTIMTAEIKLDD